LESHAPKVTAIDLFSLLQNGGHPKALASPLFALFFDPSHFAPPKREPTTANASPMAHGLRMALGSGGAMI